MQYRIHPKTGDRISEIGMGSAYIYTSGHHEAVKTVQCAFEGGINYFDLAAGDGQAFPIFHDALHDVREKVFYQIHFGADYTKGSYGWTLDPKRVKESITWQLKTLGTDYIDYGFIHCQDEEKDWKTYRKNGVYELLLSMQREGVVRHIGLSSHTPSVIEHILDEVPVDMLMFSINPAYDYGQGTYANGSVDERSDLYRRCAKENIGITVMKPFSGGQLLDAHQSPFGEALTPFQCIRYCLDKPGVMTVLPGAQTADEIRQLLRYDTDDVDTDYSVIGSFAPTDAGGKCVYCNHCRPCPQGLDIGTINKFYDLALASDVMAIEHYWALEKTAEDCVMCGHCDQRCPFHVHQSKRMKEIGTFMGQHRTTDQ